MENKTVKERIRNEQSALLEKLKTVPVVTIACKLTNVSRATFYRWIKENEKFARTVDEAINESTGIVTDMAESNVIGHVKKGDINTSKYWLKYHHHVYGAKLRELKTRYHAEISKEDKQRIRRAIRLMKVS